MRQDVSRECIDISKLGRAGGREDSTLSTRRTNRVRSRYLLMIKIYSSRHTRLRMMLVTESVALNPPRESVPSGALSVIFASVVIANTIPLHRAAVRERCDGTFVDSLRPPRVFLISLTHPQRIKLPSYPGKVNRAYFFWK